MMPSDAEVDQLIIRRLRERAEVAERRLVLATDLLEKYWRQYGALSGIEPFLLEFKDPHPTL